jgi:hypothetical protein
VASAVSWFSVGSVLSAESVLSVLSRRAIRAWRNQPRRG